MGRGRWRSARVDDREKWVGRQETGDARQTDGVELGWAKRFSRVSRVLLLLCMGGAAAGSDISSSAGEGRIRKGFLPSFLLRESSSLISTSIIYPKPQPQNRKPHRQRKYRLNCGSSSQFCCCLLLLVSIKFLLASEAQNVDQTTLLEFHDREKRAASGSAPHSLVQRTNHAELSPPHRFLSQHHDDDNNPTSATTS